GQGVGRLINAYAFEYAERLRACNQNLAYEFCTYYLNTESLHMAKKAGFRIVQRFYAISKKGIKVCQRPEIIEEYGLNLFKSVRKYIPSGWQSVHKHPDSLPWLKARCTVFKTPKAIYLLGGISGKSIFPLTRFQGDIKQELPYFQYFYSSYKPIEIILPRSWKGVLPELQKKKFKFWEPNPDLKPNMYILRKY
ncbi:MAG: hypothetical protein PHI68_02560, partial [Candidatus Cloacimonetes bacterium]|nr:hypothetical protein [Candidatus Cloacimonadota bacterium]